MSAPILIGFLPKENLSIGFVTSRFLGQDYPAMVDPLGRVADIVLCSSKPNGRGRHRKYDQVLEGLYVERRGMLDALPPVITNSEFDFLSAGPSRRKRPWMRCAATCSAPTAQRG
ncbi:MAG: hypothetical protein HKP51_06960 [Sulfitobacter sp.]|nr:hypothetical protein [Sulfitobacter sp.]